MLNSSSPAQKNLSEEDSSGSEPETDRFGFILTNGSTAGSLGPPPELVRQREAKWIKIIDQWDRILSKKSSKVKVQCQKGIPASLRAKCWPLLCGAANRMKQHENLYETLDEQPALQSWVDVIERDLDRQFPFHEMFQSKDGHGQRGLFRVLKAYTQYQPDEGYCQAQGPVAAVLLMNMPAQEAFWCLVQISEQYLPGYYSPLLEGVLFDAAMLTWVLKKTCPAAHKHLQNHGVEPLMFATDWLMCLFTRHLPFNTLLRVWDLFFCYGVRVLLQVAAVLVRRVLGRAEQRKQCQGQMETLEKLRGVKEQVHDEDDEFIAEVCAVPLSGKDLEKQTEKELEKWRKEKPSSTFDPRGRCHGYRKAWARARQHEIEKERKEREKGNLSVPLTRSASSLSLSPSLLHKKWRKAGKGNTVDSEGSNKVVRHLSMGGREDWKSWNEFDFKKVQGVKEEEDVVSEGQKEGQTEQKEISQTPDKMQETKNIQTEETAAGKEKTENTEKGVAEIEESSVKETETGDVRETEKSVVRETEMSVVTEPSDVRETDSSDVRETETNDVSKTEASVVRETETSVVRETETSDVRETDSSDVRETGTSVVRETGTSVVRETETSVVRETETSDVRETEPSDVRETETNDVSKTETSVVRETETSDVRETETSDVRETEPNDVSKTETSDVRETETSDVRETETSDVRETETSDVREAGECKLSDMDETKLTEINESKMLSEAKQEEKVAPDQTVENILHPTDYTPHCEQEEKLDAESESQVLEEQSHNSEDQEVELKDTNEEAEKHVVAVEENHSETPRIAEADTNTEDEMQMGVNAGEEQRIQADVKSEESADTESVQQVEMDTEVTESKSETSVDTDRGVEALTVDDQNSAAQAETRQEKEELSKETEKGALEVKYHSTESLVETEKEAESHTQRDTENEVLTHNQENSATQCDIKVEITEVDSEQREDSKTEIELEEEILMLSSPECTQQKESTGAVDDTETKAEITVEKDTVEASNKATEEIVLNVHLEAQVESDSWICAQKITEETPTETQTYEKPADSATPMETEESSAPVDQLNHTTEPDEESSVQISSSETQAPEQTTSQVTVGPEDSNQKVQQVEPTQEEEITEKVKQTPAGEDDVFISSEPTNVPQVQCSQSAKEPPVQTPERRSSRSSADFCVRKSSTSRSSRLARRLSEDLFTTPQKTSENQPEAKLTESQCNPKAVTSKQAAPDLVPPAAAAAAAAAAATATATTEEAPTQQQPQPDTPKRFGLFRRLRGEQHKDNKAKKAPKMQVPKILIQDFSDMPETGNVAEEEAGDKLNSKERRRRRREQARKEKEEERMKKKKEKELEKGKGKEKERRKPQTRGKSFQVQKEKSSDDAAHPAKTDSQTIQRHSAGYAEAYF
ncbi:calponin homology domain-containing protein DDB_G0272472 [Oreochromis niloticus]|uniref:calponin homology domain-containing protein DDB_G0272472 n=1 Tax=Oreochromis niloticus TaxID=8128 RepID=UPI0003946ACF|nr:calponin homology domain-containing protein DDB_G0272472 [Oreochromis niloticus]